MKISWICSNPFRVAGSQVLSIASGSIARMLAAIRSCSSRRAFLSYSVKPAEFIILWINQKAADAPE